MKRTGRSGPRGPGHSSLVQSLVFTQQPACSSIRLTNQFSSSLSSLTNLDDIFQFLFTDLWSRQIKLPSPDDLLLLFELLDLGLSSSYELLSLIRLATFIVTLALLAFLLLLLNLLGTFTFGSAKGGTDGSGEHFGGFLGGVVESRSWAVLERNIGIVLVVSMHLVGQ